ncbi:amidase [Govanella unica]|uniref:Amidase n=1 Tax=Govanella unica TaxID=2975056 RepID=A0A9X3TXJ5_9PROT|nr:amidase [Govania unica]MDA5193464.1 amidase [Govania unica]
MPKQDGKTSATYAGDGIEGKLSHSMDRRKFCGLAAAAGLIGSQGFAAVAAQNRERVTVSDIVMMDGLELSRSIRSKILSCREVMTAYLDHIERFNPKVNAIIMLRDRADLLREADTRDAELARGDYGGWMHGFPQAVKDLSDVKGLRTTWGSPLFVQNIAIQDSAFVARMRKAGSIFIGKTNTPEFGLGSQSYNTVHGTTLNAYDQTKTAGGSSGGAAVALALRMVPVADGSDFAGSLRNPAAYNNVFGMRPSFGRVPDSGGELFVSQLGVAGPMARTVSDLAMLLAVQAGPDPRAPLSIEQDPALYTEPLKRDFKQTRIGWLGDFKGYLAMEPGVMELCKTSFKAFESIGCVIEDAHTDFSLDQLWTATVILRNWMVGGGLGALYKDPAKRARLKPEAQWEVERGLALSAEDVYKASTLRSDWYRAVLKLFDHYDYLLLPTAQVFPFDAKLHWPKAINGRAMDSYHRWMEIVLPITMSGCPAINVPVGFNAQGLPMGVQIVGRNHGEQAVMQLAYAYEQATGWVQNHLPPLLLSA